MSRTERLGMGQKAMHLNYKEDGIRLRAAAFKNKRAYDRNASKRDWKKDA